MVAARTATALAFVKCPTETRLLIAVSASSVRLVFYGIAGLGNTELNRRTSMAVTLNRRAYEHAKALIDEGRFVFDERDDWSKHQPSALHESEYIRLHGSAEYGKWFLGINDERPENTKAHYAFPFGDFRDIHRCGVLAAESRAGQYRHYDIENAAAHLHGMLEGRKAATVPKRTRTVSPNRASRGTRHSLR
jgi:hypothetical protein